MIRLALALALVAVPAGVPQATDWPTPPAQPTSGPGSATYTHSAVTKTLRGEGVDECWIFEPAEPRPETAPVVVFLHGWAATSPRVYGGWIDHLVRQGNVVLFPRYQFLTTKPAEFTPNAVGAVRAAFEVLDGKTHVAARRDRVSCVGHSMGGVLAANLAAVAAEEGLPPFRAVFCTAPGITKKRPDQDYVELADLAKIPADTLLLTMAFADDALTGDADAKRIYRETTAIPAANKDYVLVHADDHGRPRLKADHNLPVAVDSRYGAGEEYTTDPEKYDRAGINARDWYALWRPFDALRAAAIEGEHRDVALGNTEAQRDQGKWSDGTPVRELEVTDLEAPQ